MTHTCKKIYNIYFIMFSQTIAMIYKFAEYEIIELNNLSQAHMSEAGG